MELICKNQEEASLLLNHFYTTLFEEKISAVKNKGFNILNILENNSITKNFKKELKDISDKRKKSSNE
jgi:hypothetical protein